MGVRRGLDFESLGPSKYGSRKGLGDENSVSPGPADGLCLKIRTWDERGKTY